MKRSFSLTLVALFTSLGAFAQADRTVLKLRMSDNSIISVNLDGRFIDRQTTQLTLDGLRPGLHRLEVYADAGYRRRPVRVYTGTLRLAPATINIGTVDVYNRGLRLRTRPMDERGYADGRDYDNDNRDRDYRNDNPQAGNNRNEYEYDDRRNNSGGGDDVYGNGNTSSNAGEGYGSFPHGRNGSSSAGSYSALSIRDMDDLRSRVASRMTDSDKEQLMKSVLQSRAASTEQIRQMLGWLSFDATRLDFAKWAYSHASDPRNYWKLEDGFSFDSSKEEFSKSISSR